MSELRSDILEKVLVQGDLSALNADERLSYLKKICESLGLNPLTRPFEYIELPGPSGTKKLTLYARKDCTEQLRKINKISIHKVEKEKFDDLYVFTAYAKTPDGREDCATAAIHLIKEETFWETSPSGKKFPKKTGKLIPLVGDDLANAIMKCETKAKRRVTLSICGLGFTDESELDTIKGAKKITEEPVKVIEVDQDFLDKFIGPIVNSMTMDELRTAYNIASSEFKDKPDIIKRLNMVTNKKKGELEFIEELDQDEEDLTKAMEKKELD